MQMKYATNVHVVMPRLNKEFASFCNPCQLIYIKKLQMVQNLNAAI